MTWAEFQIRRLAYKRMEINEWKKIREIAYTSLIAPYQDPKRIPRSRNKFMDLEGKNHRVKTSDSTKERFIELYKKYLNSKNATA